MPSKNCWRMTLYSDLITVLKGTHPCIFKVSQGISDTILHDHDSCTSRWRQTWGWYCSFGDQWHKVHNQMAQWPSSSRVDGREMMTQWSWWGAQEKALRHNDACEMAYKKKKRIMAQIAVDWYCSVSPWTWKRCLSLRSEPGIIIGKQIRLLSSTSKITRPGEALKLSPSSKPLRACIAFPRRIMYFPLWNMLGH